MPHQREAVEWLKRRGGRGLVYADAGTGKTFIAVTYCREAAATPTLVLCPASLKFQWREEILRVWPEASLRVIDGDKETRSSIWKLPREFDFTIANYELLGHGDDFEMMKVSQWGAIVCDESHNVNSPTAIRTKALKKLESPCRIALSGDPFPNAPWEAYSIVDWVEPGLLPSSWYAFKSVWCVVHKAFPSKVVGLRDSARFMKAIAPVMFRVEKSVLTDLPPKSERVVWVDLSTKEREMYDQVLSELRLKVRGEEKFTVTNLVAQITRLRQLVDAPWLFDPELWSTKLDVTVKLVDDQVKKGKVIVFAEFSRVAETMSQLLHCPRIDGSRTPTERAAACKMLQEDPDTKLMVLTAAGGYGLNLTAAKTVIHYGVPWTWARTTQRASRAWRKGQTQEVEEIFVLARGTVDERMWKLVQSKKGMAGKFSREELAAVLLDEKEPF